MTVKNDFPMSEILWYKIGGKAKYVLECTSKEDIIEAVQFIQKTKPEKVFVCGMGTNLIFTDDYYDGAVIRILPDEKGPQIIRQDGTVYVECFAGNILQSVVNFSLENNFAGLEWAGGLPGSVGGAVRGDAGAFTGEMRDVVESVEIIDYSENPFRIQTLSNEQLEFVYRGSLIKNRKNLIAISARFKLREGTPEEAAKAREICERNIQYRKDHHPLEYPSCGSVYKNIREPERVAKVVSVFPELKDNIADKWYGKVAMAALIEKLGFKGYRVGDAQISDKHSLFIVNTGHAKAGDVIKIITDVQNKFQDTFGFSPETEVEIVK